MYSYSGIWSIERTLRLPSAFCSFIWETGHHEHFSVNSFQISKFMFYYHNQLLPSMFLNVFETSHQVHNYGTRIANSYRPHFCRTNVKQFTILYQGPKIWNSLPGSIINSSSYLKFKKNTLGFLLKKTELLMPLKHCVRLFRLMIGI